MTDMSRERVQDDSSVFSLTLGRKGLPLSEMEALEERVS